MKNAWDWLKKHPLILGLLAGLSYGLFCRMLIYNENTVGFAIVAITSFGFVFLVPFAMGYLTIEAQNPMDSKFGGFLRACLFPWIPTVLALLAAFFTGFELMGCVIMASPVFLFMSSLGGIAAHYNPGKGRPRQMVLASVLVLPLGVSTAENFVPLQPTYQLVHTQIDIQASPETVWHQIKSVPEIAGDEHVPNFFHAVGFPRPLAATLSHEGVGAVRHASFEEKVLFIETVTEWDPPKALAFTIDPELSKATSPLLNGMILGGDYFDVLDGRYEIEVLNDSSVRLHLSSKHRVSTHYNLYAGFWTDWIMADLQNYILRVIKLRAEQSASVPQD